MTSITVRNLDASTKQALRERAAHNGRSMEEEVRLLLKSLEEPAPIAHAEDGVPTASPAGLGPPSAILAGKRILLIISGGIAAYKCLDLIRRLKERGATIRTIMTRAATEFISPLSVEALSHEKVFVELFDREAEHDIGHIRLSREADLIVAAPATADLMAKMANGHADDLASTALLAADVPILIAPAMNPKMWTHPATKRNVGQLNSDGYEFIGPMLGEMAETGEAGAGRMAEPMEIVSAVESLLDDRLKPLAGLRAIVTSGPTHEPIDPVRYIANRSSGRQGHAIAQALADAGADVQLISGPVNIPDPVGVTLIKVQTAREMQEAVEAVLPADIAVMVAAVADWRSESRSDEKMKKKDGKGPGSLKLTENPDILKGLGHHKLRPRLLIGFAAETEQLEKHAAAKLKRKKADWIVANDVSPETGIMGGDDNAVRLLTKQGGETWPAMSKQAVAVRLVERIAKHLIAETAEA